MSEVVRKIAQKKFDEMRHAVIVDAVDVVLETIASQAYIERKDKLIQQKSYPILLN